jgi:hypothetical protein
VRPDKCIRCVFRHPECLSTCPSLSFGDKLRVEQRDILCQIEAEKFAELEEFLKEAFEEEVKKGGNRVVISSSRMSSSERTFVDFILHRDYSSRRLSLLEELVSGLGLYYNTEEIGTVRLITFYLFEEDFLNSMPLCPTLPDDELFKQMKLTEVEEKPRKSLSEIVFGKR